MSRAQCPICHQMVNVKLNGTLNKHTKTCIPVTHKSGQESNHASKNAKLPTSSLPTPPSTSSTSTSQMEASSHESPPASADLNLWENTTRENEAYLKEKAAAYEAEQARLRQRQKEKDDWIQLITKGCKDAACYAWDDAYNMYDVNNPPKKKKCVTLSPSIRKKEWKLVEVFWNSNYGDTSDLCYKESEFQYVKM